MGHLRDRDSGLDDRHRWPSPAKRVLAAGLVTRPVRSILAFIIAVELPLLVALCEQGNALM
jgi:hypothetical protein